MEIKLTTEEQNKLKESFRENLPLFEELNKAILEIEEYYLKEFQEQDEELKDILINNESIKEEDLEEIYLSELAEIKKEILLEAEESLQEVKEYFISLNQPRSKVD